MTTAPEILDVEAHAVRRRDHIDDGDSDTQIVGAHRERHELARTD